MYIEKECECKICFMVGNRQTGPIVIDDLWQMAKISNNI